MILEMSDNVFKIDLIPDNAEISISKDETILTASLRNDIQHLHACGGLGMCSTCRVEILEGEENLSQKSNSEQKLSEKLELPSNIRLACQTKIKGNVKLKRLLLDQKDLILANQMTKNSVGSIGSTKNLALMFVDIVSFTPLSEQLPSYDVMYILNRYFDDMGTIVKKNGGDINNFIGDAFLAAFGIDDKIDSVYRCTQAALEILEDVDKKKKVFLDNYNINFDVRVGVHYGEAIVGMLGNAGNQRLSIIGQSVNIASRVETANKEAETRLLISEEAFKEIEDRAEVEDFVRVKLKGSSQRSTLYEISKLKGKSFESKNDKIFESGMFWNKIMLSKDLNNGDKKKINHNDEEILIVRNDDNLSAFSNLCPHMNLPLEMGQITTENEFLCPFHDSKFCLRTGAVKKWVITSPDWAPEEAVQLTKAINMVALIKKIFCPFCELIKSSPFINIKILLEMFIDR